MYHRMRCSGEFLWSLLASFVMMLTHGRVASPSSLRRRRRRRRCSYVVPIIRKYVTHSLYTLPFQSTEKGESALSVAFV
ncbi:uncharacterized protein LAESUDRAFT_578319 [Laetiporus sulphureus 93-53]|uniref:Secreted protein n=1 Tax=Laetiporus sulphureus 93-53 TaxID=1314785 RepID=A0A165B0C5_9APHY|nr:uncharacterized protein LAESUDRAFT_578319 [Laetiporus sulphureus 93-53]KZS99990.1 hypothetical protein LAESUDRAFT_578319 [Laetiporus sulphureus 93-53]